MFIVNFFRLLILIVSLTLLLRFLCRTRLIVSVKKLWRLLEEICYAYQFYKVPKFNENMQENQLYRKVYAYLNSLPCIEDSDSPSLFSNSKSAEIGLVLDENQTLIDSFLGTRIYWKIEKRVEDDCRSKSLVLKMRKNDKRRILVPYFQHIHQVFDEIQQKRNEVRLFINVDDELQRNGRWKSAPFTHPATMETVVMDVDLLYGTAGTGKSTFIAAMARFLNYDIYEINLDENSKAVSISGILNFMDGIISGCGEERVLIFTVNSKENIDGSILRPGRIDVHINFPLCDFPAFKSLANSHLGLKDHKLFPQVEEIFQTGASLSPAEIGEIMISNRGSPSRALKTVITALQGNLACRVGKRLTGPKSGPVSDESRESVFFGKDGPNGIHPIKEIKTLYGLLRTKSSRKVSFEKLDPTRESDG